MLALRVVSLPQLALVVLLVGCAGAGGQPVDGGAGGSGEGGGSAAGGGNGGGSGGGGGGDTPDSGPGELSDLATPIDPNVPTDFANANAFLFTGPNAIQTGVGANAIDPRRMTILRGRVLARDGAPMPGVTVSCVGHPEYGVTATRADGHFDFVANGGDTVMLSLSKQGYLTAQRQLATAWRSFEHVKDVVLIALDAQATAITSGLATPQLARGSLITDDDGTRQATVFVPSGTSAGMTAGGVSQPLTTLHVRATEYTVGPSGPATMPASLPPESAYTYAVELSVDEARAAGATSVEFSQALPFYLDNFLGFPAGTVVPTGFYDAERGAWVASTNGVVLTIVSITAGRADLDLTGTGAASSPTALAALGVTDEERAQLASVYAAGKSLWRVPVRHFSAWDFNWPFGPPPGAGPPSPRPPKVPKKDPAPCIKRGSSIACQSQILGEAIPLTGTPYSLRYSSDRAATWQDQVVIPLSDATIPGPLKRIDLEIDIAGRHFEQSFPAQPNQSYTFVWDRRDAYGRLVQGAQKARLLVSNVYGADYGRTTRFATPADTILSGNGAREEISYSLQKTVLLGSLSPTDLAGWSLDAQHTWDSETGTLSLGDGSSRSSLDSVGGNVITTVTGRRGEPCLDGGPCGDGGPASAGRLRYPSALVGAPDGTLYVYDNASHHLRRIDPGGTITTFAGTTGDCANALRAHAVDVSACGNGGPASRAGLGDVLGLAVGPDGSVFVSEGVWVRRIGVDGVIRVVAGANRLGAPDDQDGVATEVNINVAGLAAGADGSIYLAEHRRLRRVGPDGFLTVLAGRGVSDCFGGCGDGGPAKLAQVKPTSIARAPDGTLYLDDKGSTIRRITPDGVITTIAGSAAVHRSEGDGGPASEATFLGIYALVVDSEGGLLIADVDRVRRIGIDGVITSIAGPGSAPLDGEGGPARRAWLGQNALQGLAVGFDGRVYVADTLGGLVRRIGSSSRGAMVQDEFIPSEDGAELYAFRDGRHLWTRDALTNATLQAFTYDAKGLLTQVVDRSGNATIIHRSATGAPTSIEGPYGDLTTLGVSADGKLEVVTSPGGQTVRLGYTTSGLLVTLTDPAQGLHRFSYDPLGRLLKDEDPAGGATTLTRTEGPAGYRVAVVTAAGQRSSYEIEDLPSGDVRRTGIEPSGARTEALVRADGTTRVTYPDSTVAELVEGPDPRFGMLAPIVARLVVTTPAGRSTTQTGTRTAVLVDPLTLASQTDTVVRDGKAFVRAYDAATRTQTFTSPAGRTLTITFDDKGRVASRRGDATQAPVTLAYDTHGALSQVSQGLQTAIFARDDHGRVRSRTDALGHATLYAHDEAGQLISSTTPVGSRYALGYDAAGHLTGLTMPGAGVYGFVSTAADQLSRYQPPGNAAYESSYDLDRRLTRVVLPGGRVEALGLDDAGRPSAFTSPETTVVVSALAGDATTRLAGTSWVGAGGATQATQLDYDGDLVTASRWTGAATGAYAYTYGAGFLLSQLGFTSGLDAVDTALVRDQDGLVVGIGPFLLERAGPGGVVSRVSDGSLSLTVEHDPLARPTRQTLAVAGKTAFDLQWAFDAAGRIVHEVATLGANAPSVSDYAYDADAQLTQVTRDGVVVERYTYDGNTNRLSRQLGTAAAELASYDAQDRLTQQAAVTFRFDVDGFLAQRGNDLFRYATSGELLQATVGGATITYAYDGLRRRTSRTDASGTTSYLYGNPDDDFQVTQTRAPSGVLTTYSRGDGGRLFALQRGSERFYVATDQLGSPRLVTDAAGVPVKVLSYDGFGQLRADSNPGWELPIGFAGGLQDPTTGLVRFGLRDYDPGTGRWTARDPSVLGGRRANPYAYVGNDPVNLVDASGLVSWGVTICDGVCVGAKLALTSKGLSVCAEAGFGVGSSLEADLLGDLDETGFSFEGKVGAKLGIVKAEVGVTGLSLGDCAYTDAKLKAEVCVGPGCVKPLDPSVPKGKVALEQTDSTPPGVKAKDPLKGAGFALSGKYVAKECQQVGW